MSAFAGVPSFATPHQLRPPYRHPAVMLLQGGGTQGSPAQQHNSSIEADEEHSSGTVGMDYTDEGAFSITAPVVPTAVLLLRWRLVC